MWMKMEDIYTSTYVKYLSETKLILLLHLCVHQMGQDLKHLVVSECNLKLIFVCRVIH